MKKIFWILAFGALASASVAFALARTASADTSNETR
jgi:uncharacterized membrane protein YdjX (TVP38/TMEM64 family)